MGEAPGGGNLSTYKELCSLATELGQPDLVYKFMDLANHQVMSLVPCPGLCIPYWLSPITQPGSVRIFLMRQRSSSGGPDFETRRCLWLCWDRQAGGRAAGTACGLPRA